MAIDYFAQQFGEDVYENTAPAAPAFSNADINAFVQQNIGNPQAIADAAQQYGVSPEQLSQATGYDAGTVSNYFSNAGINFGQPAPQATTPAPLTPPPPVYQPPTYQPPTTPPPQYTDPDPGFAPPTPVTSTQDPNSVQQRIIEEERKRNLEGGLASLGAGNAGGSPKPVDLGNGTYQTYGGTIIDKDGRPVVDNSKVVNDLYATIGRTGMGTGTNQIDQGGFNYFKNMLDSGMTSDQVKNEFQKAVNQYLIDKPTDEYSKYVAPTYLKTITDNIAKDTTLSAFDKNNKIFETAQQYGMDDAAIDKAFGKEAADAYRKDYGTNIKSFITTTLADTTKSDFDKVAAINQAANKYGLDPNEIAKYSGLNKTGVDKIFTTFDTGLASIVKNLSAPTVSDLDKTKGALALQQKYSVTDDQLAKALGGNITGKDVTAYLAPVKNFSTDLQTITSDETKTASDIQTFLDNAKKDPRVEGLYGLAIDKVQKAVPILGLRDSISGNGSPEQLTKGYTDFVAAVNADPALREKYGAQADAIDQVAKLSQRIADEKFGGKLQPHMFQTFIGLDQKTLSNVPKQLEFNKPETKTYTDEDGQTQTYTLKGQVKETKDLQPIYSGGDDNQLVGYTRPIKTSAGVTVDAQYDSNGTLTGYLGRNEDKVWPKHRVGISGQWDANGKASPVTQVESPGVLKNMIQDIAALGPIGQIAIAFATSGLGSLAAGALTPALGATAAKVVTSGIINGAMAEMGGGEFGKGFLTGAAGAGTNMLAKNFMPTIDTGNAFADQYFNKALPNLATSTIGAAINKQDIGQAGISSLLNTGTNMATSSLINSAMPDTLTPEMQKMFTGISGQLLSSLLQGQSPDLQKSIMNTVMQNAMSPSKATVKEKG
jgi:hypothetical protein